MFQDEKDPDAERDYALDWVLWLGQDTIATSTWIVPAGLTLISHSQDATSTLARIGGGTVRATYTVTNRVVSSSGAKEDRSITIKVMQQ